MPARFFLLAAWTGLLEAAGAGFLHQWALGSLLAFGSLVCAVYYVWRVGCE